MLDSPCSGAVSSKIRSARRATCRLWSRSSSHRAARASTLRRATSRRWCRSSGDGAVSARRDRAMVSSSTPSRSAASLNVNAATSNACATHCSTIAPATMMSARWGSSPGIEARVAAVRRAASTATTSSSSSRVNSKRLYVCGAGRPWRARTRLATVSAVPDDAIATSKPSWCTSRSNPASTDRTYERQSATLLGVTAPPGKKRSVSRTAPSLKLRAARVSPRSPTSTSVEPPPMSTSSRRRSKTGTAWSTPRWMSRASSTPEITSTSMPASSRARARNTSAFSASRTALVATARTVPPWLSAMRRIRRSAPMPRSTASSPRRFMSPPPWPSRTVSFSRVTTSKLVVSRSPPCTRATTRWKLFVPRSSAATTPGSSPPVLLVTVGRSAPGSPAGRAAHRCGRRRSSRTPCRGRRRRWPRRRARRP